MNRTVTGLSLIVAAVFGVGATVAAPAMAAGSTVNLTVGRESKWPHAHRV